MNKADKTIALSNQNVQKGKSIVRDLHDSGLLGTKPFGTPIEYFELWHHVFGDLVGTQSIVWARFMYRNPLLGPLLFSNLAFLDGLSLLPEAETDAVLNDSMREDAIFTISSDIS